MLDAVVEVQGLAEVGVVVDAFLVGVDFVELVAHFLELLVSPGAVRVYEPRRVEAVAAEHAAHGIGKQANHLISKLHRLFLPKKLLHILRSYGFNPFRKIQLPSPYAVFPIQTPRSLYRPSI